MTCIGCLSHTPVLACLASIASAVLGAIISVIIEAVDTQGQGLRLWFQHIKYWKQDIRLSFSYLFRIQVDGKYLLVKGNRLKKQFQPVGGVYKYYPEAKPTLEKFLFRPDTKMGNSDETDDLRIFIRGKHLLSFMQWFLSMKDREYDPYREFTEEMITSGLLPAVDFKSIEYRKIYVHNNGVQFSKYMGCNELVYADIFELKLSDAQLVTIRQAVKNNPDLLCLASAEELKSECFNGVERNIGNNAVWLLGD